MILFIGNVWWSKQIHGDRKQISGCLGLRVLMVMAERNGVFWEVMEMF